MLYWVDKNDRHVSAQVYWPKDTTHQMELEDENEDGNEDENEDENENENEHEKERQRKKKRKKKDEAEDVGAAFHRLQESSSPPNRNHEANIVNKCGVDDFHALVRVHEQNKQINLVLKENRIFSPTLILTNSD